MGLQAYEAPPAVQARVVRTTNKGVGIEFLSS